MRTFNVAILLCFFHLSFAKNLVLETEKDNILIGEYVEYFQADRSLEFKEAIQSNLWQQSQAEVLNFGSTSKAIWIKLTVENRSTDDLFYLELNMPYLDHFELFQKDQNGKYSSEVVGDIYRFSNREVRSVLPTFKVKHNRKSIQTYYLRVFGNESITLPIHLEGKHEWKQNKSQKDQFFGFYTGIFVLINVFSIILILIIRKTILLYYLIYSFLVYFAQTFTIVGTSQWIATDSPFFEDFKLYLATTLVGPAAIMFVSKFLKWKKLHYWAFRRAVVFSCFYVSVPILFLLIGQRPAFIAINLLNLLGTIMLLFLIGTHLVINKKEAVLILSAWMVFLLGIIMYILQNLSIINYSAVSQYTMSVGAAMETMLLALALGFRIRELVLENYLKSLRIENLEKIQINLKRSLNSDVVNRHSAGFNPHFVFNVLASNYNKVLQGENQEVAEHILQTSNLIRKGLDLSKKEWISIDEEVEFLQSMIELELFKSNRSIQIVVKCDERIDSFYTKIPSLVTQPIVENSLKYSNVYNHRNIRIEIVFEYINEELIVCTIMDDGPGLAKTKERKFKDERKSYGLEILEEKLRSASMVEEKSLINLIDRSDGDPKSTGVIVKIQIPTR